MSARRRVVLFVSLMVIGCPGTPREVTGPSDDAEMVPNDVGPSDDDGGSNAETPDGGSADASPSDMSDGGSGDAETTSDVDVGAEDVGADADAGCPPFNCFDGVAVDGDEDGCPDACCTCPPDFEVSAYTIENGECRPSCSDAKCTPEEPCTQYVCNLSGGTCDAPEGFCSNAAVCGGPCESIDFDAEPVVEVCGCDGQTWNSECEMYCNGVALDHVGPCD